MDQLILGGVTVLGMAARDLPMNWRTERLPLGRAGLPVPVRFGFPGDAQVTRLQMWTQTSAA